MTLSISTSISVLVAFATTIYMKPLTVWGWTESEFPIRVLPTFTACVCAPFEDVEPVHVVEALKAITSVFDVVSVLCFIPTASGPFFLFCENAPEPPVTSPE